MKKNFLLAFLLSSVIISNSAAQVSSLDSLIVATMNTMHSPGLSALILKKGFPVWKNAYGYAKLEDSIPVVITTDFMLASVSKTITATAIMNVSENGGFDLDDNINDYLPFTVSNPHYPDDTITFLQLLTHSSSIKDNWNVLSSVYSTGDSPIPLGEFMKDYLVPGGQYYNPNQNFFNYAPAAQYNYSNEGVALCGYLVETITGIPFDQYCNDSIFTPLCMDQTSWFLSSLDTSTIAMPYSWQSGSYQAAGYYGYPDYPDGQLRTNAIALARFLSMYMNGGKYNNVRILDSTTVATMLSLQIPTIEPTQGIVWYKYTIGGRVCWGHNGGDTGVSTNMYFSPNDSTGIILLSNGGNFYSVAVMDAMFDYAETLQPPADSIFDCNFVYTGNENTTDEEALLKIYPNPSDGIFQLALHSGKKSTLIIYDGVGNMVFQSEATGDFKFNLSDHPAGMYIVLIKQHDKIFTQKIVKTE